MRRRRISADSPVSRNKCRADSVLPLWMKTGVVPVRRFKDAATAAERIFTELQKLGGSDAEAAPADTDAPKPSARRGAKLIPSRQGGPRKGRKAQRERTSRDQQDRPTDRDAQTTERRDAGRSEGRVWLAGSLHASDHERGWLPGKEARDQGDQRESRQLAHLPNRKVKRFRLSPGRFPFARGNRLLVVKNTSLVYSNIGPTNGQRQRPTVLNERKPAR
jgi:hypothetical protein